jgi:FtsH-binding integral membrane protein
MFNWIKLFLKDLFSNSAKVDPQRRAKINKICLWLAGGLLAFFVFLAIFAANTPVSSDSAWWQAVVSARLTCVRLVMALPVIAFGVLCSSTIFNITENSKMGHRYLSPDASDSDEIKSKKIGNSGILIACVTGAILNSLVISLLK